MRFEEAFSLWTERRLTQEEAARLLGEGTASSFVGAREVIEQHGLLCSLYTDRASHYWNTPVAGGKVDKNNLTQFGRAMHQLGIEMIPSY